MRFSTVFALIATSGLVEAKHLTCNNGIEWGEFLEVGEERALTTCREFFTNREYLPHQNFRICFSLGPVMRAEYWVTMQTYPAKNLTLDHCLSRMEDVMRCLMGGVYHETDWLIAADPIEGGVCN